MSAGYAPPEVPLYEDQETRDEQYRAAEAEGRPFFAVERYDDGYALTFDLLPAAAQLSEPVVSELEQVLTQELEAIVGDPSSPTTEVSRSVGNSLGNVSFFQREETAREVAATVSRIVLDEDNWVPATPPGTASGTSGADFRSND